MKEGVVCLVTIHGIGFQQPPGKGVDGQPDTPGYADFLHEHLSKYLDASFLSDDPHRTREQRGQNGPIYVRSTWPPGTYNIEAGLSRLGNWDMLHRGIVDLERAPLRSRDAPIAHVALVYSQPHPLTHQLAASLIAGTVTLFSLGHYTHIAGLVHLLFYDTSPLLYNLLHQQASQSGLFTPSLCLRQDAPFTLDHDPVNQQQVDLMAIIKYLENDVAAYICHNELRTNIRYFIRDALLRLAYREDVDCIVINAHSNGTVLAFDILRELPPFAARKIAGLVTAGSPLRKYTTLFAWGNYMSTYPKLARWVNFLDLHDPVADPLAPSLEWRRGDQVAESDRSGLYKAIDPHTGLVSDLEIVDRVVDNLRNSKGGGLQAHNYWDNEMEFVRPLARLLKQIATQTPVPG